MLHFKFFILIPILIAGLLLPQDLQIPVEGATHSNWNPDSYWAYPWGKSVVHKGVDIYEKKGTPVLSATDGYILSSGYSDVAGNYILILGPKWRLHYYAHLNEITKVSSGFIAKGDQIGTVGKTGNAKNTPAHLHYVIATLIPYPWRADDSVHGWKKMIYLNPIPFMDESKL